MNTLDETLDPAMDPVALTAALVDVPSPSHEEGPLADLVEQALNGIHGIEVIRRGDTVAARTHRRLPQRVVLAGHLDTVPVADNLPHRIVDDVMHGCGTVDMKSGLAVYLHLFATLATSPDLHADLTFIAYECEEVDSRFNGLGLLAESDPEWLEGDLALLGEPSGAVVEAGCQGTMRVRVSTHGTRAHSARGWLGDNAAHRLAEAVARVAAYEARSVDIDGLTYREGLNVVKLHSYVATNVIPDEAYALVNHRFAPDRSAAEAFAHVQEVLHGFDVALEDVVEGALPGLHHPAAQSLVAAVGGMGHVRAKYGWTDVARFARLGVPALNFGPGDPAFAHRLDEQVPLEHITRVTSQLRNFLTRLRG